MHTTNLTFQLKNTTNITNHLMSFVNSKQQRLIEDSISNYVKFYDKTSLQYLKLRQEIFLLSQQVTSSPITFDTKFKVKQLTFELDKVSEVFLNHLHSLHNLLEIRKNVRDPYVEQITKELKLLETSASQLEEEITDIKQVQKPLLDKMKLLVKGFEANLGNKSKNFHGESPLISQGYSTKSSQIDYDSLKFTMKELKELFADVGDVELEEVLRGNKNFEAGEGSIASSDTEILYRINKSTPHGVTAKTSIEEYDKLIESSIASVRALENQEKELKDEWRRKASRVQGVKRVLEEDVDME